MAKAVNIVSQGPVNRNSYGNIGFVGKIAEKK